MQTFATDIDLLHWEPNIMTDAANVAQMILGGSGSLSGSSFTIASGSLTDAHVSDEHVILLSGSVAGSFPIFSVDNATTLSLSVLYDELHPNEGSFSPWAPKGGDDVSFVIRTFWPQRSTVSAQLLQAAGIKPADVSQIVNAEVLQRPCVLGTLQMIYTALAANSESAAALLTRAALYERLYQRAMRNALLEIDRNGDGVVDQKRPLSVVDLRRA